MSGYLENYFSNNDDLIDPIKRKAEELAQELINCSNDDENILMNIDQFRREISPLLKKDSKFYNVGTDGELDHMKDFNEALKNKDKSMLTTIILKVLLSEINMEIQKVI